MINKVSHWTNQAAKEELKKSLLNNTVSIINTDTVLGFVAPITKEGFLNLNEIKGERGNKPYLILIASPKKLPIFINVEKLTTAMLNVIKHGWPGPLTIIFQALPSNPFYLKSSQETIALRCPQHKELLELLEGFDGLFSTSANKSGEQPPKGQPSTIIDFSETMNNSEAPIRIIRKGAYPIKDLEEYYGQTFTQ